MIPRGTPRRLEINLGLLCNNRCVFCMSSKLRDAKSPWAPVGKVKDELAHFYGEGCRSVGFLGGEPTVYPHLLECVAFAKRLGYARIAICTNGTRLSDAAFCRRLVSEGVTRVTLSVHSHRAEIEDRLITRVPGNFARKLAAIRNLLALVREGHLRDNVSLNPVLSRKTCREMADYIVFFSGLGVRDIRFNYIWPEGDAEDDPEWIPAFRDAVPEIVRLLILNETRFRLRLTFGGVPPCTLRLAGISERLLEHLAGKYLDEASYDPATQVSRPGAGAESSQRFVWQEEKRNVLKAMSPECGSCRHFSGCEGVWKTYVRLYGFEEFKPLLPGA